MHLYERIVEDLTRSIEEGEIRPGERLPSIREVAERYGCNKLTAQRSFDLLAAGGFVENRPGSGSYVRFPAPPEERAGDFSAARLSEDFFPYEEAGRLFGEVLAVERGRVFSASGPRGEPRLIEALARRFALPPESLFLISGGQQGLDLCRRLFSGAEGPGGGPTGRRGGIGKGAPDVLVEEPTYPGALSLFRPRASLPFGAEGPDPEAFERHWAERRGAGAPVYYAVPDLHNPTGLRYSLERKRAIAEAARRREVYIVEDDYVSELEPSGLPRFVDLAPERTVWIKSLSKAAAPGLRIGLVAAPPGLREELLHLRAETDTGPAAWLQFFAERLLASGLLDRHQAACAGIATRRRGELLALLARFPGLSTPAGSRGYNLWVAAPEEPRLGAAPWAEGARFGLGAGCRSHFRLSFMSVGEAEWPAALARLERALSAAFARS
ncbi:MAG: PLP-dependent aminotransferase family protein [Spirochaetaceae bacterium]|nr:PLP-dependent aminotransferase family protein [Spirochaetaceae bacterium]